MKLKSKKKKGFTLIELVAVVAILAILAAVLVPSVGGYITRSRKAAVITQCREFVNAVETYDLTAKNKIEKTKKVSDLVGDGKVLTNADLLTDTKLDKIQEITIEKAREINADDGALDKIKINKDTHIFESYAKIDNK